MKKRSRFAGLFILSLVALVGLSQWGYTMVSSTYISLRKISWINVGPMMECLQITNAKVTPFSLVRTPENISITVSPFTMIINDSPNPNNPMNPNKIPNVKSLMLVMAKKNELQPSSTIGTYNPNASRFDGNVSLNVSQFLIDMNTNKILLQVPQKTLTGYGVFEIYNNGNATDMNQICFNIPENNIRYPVTYCMNFSK